MNIRTNVNYRRGCILCEKHFDMECTLHSCEHENERDCTNQCVAIVK
jgi:hypothetical protein